ncbi:site-specific DNA-methyltransferase [Castellaniella daejeonensis]|uniref:site-specific DNA-methyltransferase (adenine-specific) n=1 Tax=Castellaniella daejeonensis TaxID=659013 RepID=A0ABN0TD66_9BURK
MSASSLDQDQLRDLMLSLVPNDGTTIGNTALRRAIEAKLQDGTTLSDDAYWQAHAALIANGLLVKGQGRGGSVRLAFPTNTDSVDKADHDGFLLETQQAPDPDDETTPPAPRRTKSTVRNSRTTADEAQILSYRHADKRVNNPEVGMVTPATDPEEGKTKWAYDPHLDPALHFVPQRSQIERLIDDALASGDTDQMRAALEELKRQQSPYLNWAGKAERTNFDIDTVSLHVHERIDPASILAAVRKAMTGKAKSQGAAKALQPGLFDAPFENLPLRDAIDFYRHERGWANRLISGDSLLVMNSLLQKENMAGRVQMIYIDPPYGIKYGSNFQPFVGKRDVKDRKDEDLTQEPEMIKAFRDTWELGIHSYLTYLRDRLLLARELLNETGSVFVQISEENVHHVRELLDEIIGESNFMADIIFIKAGALGSVGLPRRNDYILWYCKNKSQVKYHQLFLEKDPIEDIGAYRLTQEANGKIRPLKNNDDLSKVRPLRYVLMTKPGPGQKYSYEFQGREITSGSRWWGFPPENLERLRKSGRIANSGTDSIRYLYDFPASYLSNVWLDTATGSGMGKIYVVQTNEKVIERCLLMTTDPGDLVLDPTCGSGTTAFVAEKWGRRWITCDTSRVAVTLAKQRLMTASYDYFDLKYPQEGLKGGFVYKTVPHITLKSIANNPEIDTIYEKKHPAIEASLAKLNQALHTAGAPVFTITEGGRKGQELDFSQGDALFEWEVPFDCPEGWHSTAQEALAAFHSNRQAMQAQMDASISAHADQETLYDQPTIARDKLRITGPFTVEAVPFPSVKSLDEADGPPEADTSIARTGESGRQHQWRDELLKTGIRGKGGQKLNFADLEPLPTDDGMKHLHATGHLDSGERVVVSFGPEYGALEQRQVTNALTEAGNLFPLPKMIVFCAFAFDPEAAKDIDALRGITALKAQMNTDLLTDDLRKARAHNQSFWLMGQPEVEVRKVKGDQYVVEVHGFDYFDTVKGELISGGKKKIAMWALDTDYDERSLFPRQVFFPMAGRGEGWEKLKKSIRAELDEARLDTFHGTVSLPFQAGDNRKIAVKIVDDRGIESLKVIPLD